MAVLGDQPIRLAISPNETQRGGTERPGTGEYLHHHEPGIYVDVVSAPLRFVHRKDMEAKGYGEYLNPIEEN